MMPGFKCSAPYWGLCMWWRRSIVGNTQARPGLGIKRGPELGADQMVCCGGQA